MQYLKVCLKTKYKEIEDEGTIYAVCFFEKKKRCSDLMILMRRKVKNFKHFRKRFAGYNV